MRRFELVGWAAALACIALVLLPAPLPSDASGLLLPVGASGGAAMALYWTVAAVWLGAAVVGIRARRWRTFTLGGIVVAGTLTPSLLLLAACATGNCI